MGEKPSKATGRPIKITDGDVAYCVAEVEKAPEGARAERARELADHFGVTVDTLYRRMREHRKGKRYAE